MIRHSMLMTGGLVATAVLLQGCFDSSSGPSDSLTTDEEGIQNVLFEEQADLADPDVRFYDDASSDAENAAIATNWWRRELLSLDKTVDIHVENPDEGPSIAEVVVHADATGILHLFVCEDSTRTEYQKEFADSAVRSMLFEKNRPIDRPHRGWQVQALSGVLIRSENTTREIQSVRLQAGDVDVTIDDVESLVPVEEITRLPRGQEVTVTVTTGDATDGVFLHLRHLGRRLELTNNGDGTYSGTFFTNGRRGPRHLVVDVLSNGTLYDDVAPYDNVAWGIPYGLIGDDES
ncbi:MAG: hypothetical protein R3B81_07475 [bacterium]